VALVASQGVVRAAEWILQRGRSVGGDDDRGRERVSDIIASLLCVAGVAFAVTHRVLIYPAERESFVSVREAMQSLGDHIAENPGERHRLLAPLPCDLPALFYRERKRIPVEINGVPEEGEVVWLLARLSETPADVLRSPLIGLGERAEELEPWSDVAEFETLRLHRSVRPPVPPESPP
jgi:hypothetical protein